MVDVSAAGARRAVHEAQAITRLGEGLAGSGRLGEAAMGRTLETVGAYCRTAEALGAREVLIVGTSAVRQAENGRALAERIRQLTGHPVRIVPGHEEARLALLGVLDGLPRLGGSFVLFDIGGGSTEFILARDRRLARAVSLSLGVVPLAERHTDAGPLERAGLAGLEHEIRALLDAGLADFAPGERPDHLVGTAGTVTTLAALDQGLEVYDPARVHGYVLTRERVRQWLERLAALSVTARAALPCLPAGRADVIVPGAAICLAVMARFEATALLVSDRGLREGILIEYLKSLESPEP